ncbi:MAG: PrsW family intramembrane metalloprotease [Halanaeroarchaeum sp.]
MTPRRVLRIARWETTRSVGSVDRRTGLALLTVVLVMGAMVPAFAATNPTPSEGLYRVGVAPESPYHEVVAETPSLQGAPADRAALESGSIDVLVRGTDLLVRDTEKGRAAAAALRDAIVSYNDRLMAQETDEAAAFPVSVSLHYVEQDPPALTGGGSGGTGDGGTDGGAGDTGGGAGGTTAGGRDGTGDDTGGIGGGGTGAIGGGGLPSPPTGGIFGATQTGTPSAISPPFPLRSLLLAFVFLLPLNVIIQAYGSTVVTERINRRGEPLLVSPASRGDIVLGKTLPYFGVAILVTAAIALAIGGGVVTVVAIAPLAGLFLASTFLAGMLSRSYKELTFVTVTISVGLTSYAFIPAVFAEVHPIAAISPLTIVVNDLRSMPVDPGTFVLATVPVTLAAVVLFVLGTGIYREEDMFTQRPLTEKVLDALAAPLEAVWRVGLWTGLFIPFVLVAELFAVAVLFVLPVTVSVPLLLAAVALVEEVAKSVHVLAGFERARFERTWRRAVAVGAASGIGFFVAEKALLVTQLVGLPELELGRAAFAPAVLGVSPVVLLFAPLVVHVTTATIAALGASRSRRWYAGGLLTAVLVHLAYNLAVVSTLA